MLRRILAVGACIAAMIPLAGCTRHSPSATLASNSSRGAALFAQQCSACHGAAGIGGSIAPSLRGRHLGAAAVRFAIEHPQPPMPKLFPAQLSARDVSDVTAYVVKL